MKGQLLGEFDSDVKPLRNAVFHPAAVEVHGKGKSDRRLQGAPTVEKVWRDLLIW
jgi:hypothetical protein